MADFGEIIDIMDLDVVSWLRTEMGKICSKEKNPVATVAVDFDGVIHDYTQGWQDGSIYGAFVEGAVAALLDLTQRFSVFIHTTRNPSQVASWIEEKSDGFLRCTTVVPENGFWNKCRLGLLLVTDRKLPAVAYIDDRAIRFRDWDQALRDLRWALTKESDG